MGKENHSKASLKSAAQSEEPTASCTLRRLFFLAAILFPIHASGAERPVELGVLTPFYRSTQLQGLFFGMGLIEIPDYLVSPDIDIPYNKKPGMAKEIPFVDTFTINRFLGGYVEAWLKKYKLWDDRLGLRSLDYAIKNDAGALQFRPELIRQRLQPYLDAGYGSEAITVDLENIPVDLARSPNDFGVWGQKSPPANADEWSAAISHFAHDLKDYLGPSASSIAFKTGAEYTSDVSFDGSAADFFSYYSATDRGLHAILPAASLSPGEFTATGTCTPAMSGCVYDTGEFVRAAIANNLAPAYVPRSLLTFIGRGNPMPSIAVARAVLSYANLPKGTIAEIHQFGLLGEPFAGLDLSAGSEPAALQANWEFQTLVGLWQTLRPRRVFHWGGIVQVGKLPFLNGSGYLRQILDHYQGYHAFHLPLSPSTVPNTELMAVGLAKVGSPSVLILSSFNPRVGDAAQIIHLALPPVFPVGTAGSVETLRYNASNNVFAEIKADLARAGNLKSEFQNCGICLASPTLMANDVTNVRSMLVQNWPIYQKKMQQSLKWKPVDGHVSLDGRELTATLASDEMLVVQLPR